MDHAVFRVPMRQWVFSFPIPIGYLFTAYPHLLSPVSQIIHSAIPAFRSEEAGLKCT